MIRQSDHRPDTFNRDFAWGCVFWVVFSVVAMLIRGVRWDENYEFAQAMLGLVPYDDGHPLRQYTLAAYNLQFYSSALILKFNDDPVLLCGFRSLLFNMATTLPVFMLGAWGSFRTWIGHVAVVFILIGVHLEFDGVYPQFIWPGMFSNGHIGMGYALIFACTLAAGHLRWAGLLLGLMPAVHLGQMPAAGLLAIVYAIRCLIQWDFEPLRRAVSWFLIGLVFCGMFYFAQQQSVLSPVTEGVYHSTSDAEAIWQGRMLSGRDMHRSMPSGNIHLITLSTLVIAFYGWRLLRRRESPLQTPWFWLGSYVYGVIAIVYGVMAVHYGIVQFGWFGGEIPYLLLGWLPYRLLNLLAPVLVVFCMTLVSEVAIAPSTRPNIVPYLIPGLLVFTLAKPLYPRIVGDSLYYRYLYHNDGIFFILIGAALGLMAYRLNKHGGIRKYDWAVPFFFFIGFFILHQYGTVIVFGAAIATYIAFRLPLVWHRGGVVVSTMLLSCLILVSSLNSEYEVRRHLPVGDFEAEVSRILEEEGKPDAMIAAQPGQVLLQAQTGHPVMTDMATEFHASYRPSLGPSVQQVYEDVYGIWFEDRGTPVPSWQSVWSGRTVVEWATLGEKYGIAFLVAPNDVELNPGVELIHEGTLDSLYRVPETENEPAP